MWVNFLNYNEGRAAKDHECLSPQILCPLKCCALSSSLCQHIPDFGKSRDAATLQRRGQQRIK